MSDGRLEHALRAALEDAPRVAAVFLFGSRARGAGREDSDVDVAVLLDATPQDEERYRVLRELLTACAGHVAVSQLDLVILNDAPPALAFQILKHGQLVLCRDEVALHRMRVRTYRMHSDYEPVERLFRRATRKRLSKEAGGG